MESPFKITTEEIDEILTNSLSTNPEEIFEDLNKKGGLDYFLNSLKTNRKKGIDASNSDKAERLKFFGDNLDIKIKEKNLCEFICEALKDPFLIILIICAIFQILVGISPLAENPEKDWIDSFGIIIAIILIIYTGSITNYSKEKQFQNLSKVNKSNSLVTILRNENMQNLHYEEILVGDVIILNQGMIIPADGILMESDDIKIDESSLTGEGKMVRKISYEKSKEIYEKNSKVPNSINNSYINTNNNNINKSLVSDIDLYNLDDMDRFKRGHSNNPHIMNLNNINDHSNLNSANSNIKLLDNHYNNNINTSMFTDSFIGKPAKIYSPFLFSGTTVNSGYGILLVLAVGQNSTKGKLQKNLLNNNNRDSEETKSPLEIKLEILANDIGRFGFFAAIMTFIVLFGKLFYIKYKEYEYHNQILRDHIFNSTSNLTNKELINLYDINIKNNNSTNFNYSISYKNDNIFLSEKKNNTNFFFNITNSDHLVNPNKIFEGIEKEIFTIIILCITIIVVAIPEGLPLAVTLALSFSVSKMLKFNNLVRNMNACEVVGGANYICTDKTGTLTKNKLELKGFLLHDLIFEKKMKNLNKNFTEMKRKMSSNNFDIFINSILGNVNIELDSNNKIANGLEIDRAIYDFFLENFDETFEIFKENKSLLYDRINFNSNRKKSTSILRLNNKNNNNIPNKFRIYVKGAPELILNSCNKILNCNKNLEENFNEANKNLINSNIEKFASMNYRLIALAYKEVNENEIKNFRERENKNINLENTENNINITDDFDLYNFERENFCYLGMLIFKDSIRENVSEAVVTCKKAGIKVIMITGDNPISALAIAQDCNIINPNEISFLDKENNYITGSNFYNKIGGLFCQTCEKNIENCKCPITIEEAEKKGLPIDKIRKDKIRNLEAFEKIVKKFSIFARTKPIDKYCLIKGLRELDNVVAVTGDGTNDAMALKKSDVGFSMGINGTDIAKNASDIILLDDNFASIVNGVLWGRGIFDNIRKFIQFQLSINISATLLVFCCSCIGSESPISSIQMLWLNMIMDSLGSLCLATEEPRNKLLKRKPHSKREYIINNTMWKHIFIQALFQFVISILLYLYAPNFIRENNPQRIFISQQMENCFGKNAGNKKIFEGHRISHFIMDGKKTNWDPFILIKRNLSKDYCFFYNRDIFPQGKINNLNDAYKWMISEYGNTVHMTIIFNTFVFYGLFNQINCRILDDSFNIFENLSKNFLFVLIISIEIIVQISIVQFGGLIFNCIKGGLTARQWFLCIAISSLTFFVSILLKFINFCGECSSVFCCFSFCFCCCPCCRKKEKNEENSQLVEMIPDGYDNDSF